MIKVRKLTAIILCLVMVLGTSTAFGEELNLISAKADYNGHWAEAAIEKWLSEGKVSGYPDGSFKPDAKVTRAEFVKMVNGIIDFDGKGTISYSDVSSSDWFYNYVSVAQEVGYIQGYEGKFQPNDNITREQAAAILARIQYLDDNKDSAGKFTDSGKISSWAAGSVGASFGAGFIKGYENGEFKPQGNLTRAEAITMLDNVLENAKNYVIYKAGTQLKDYTAEGDLIVAKTVGDGDVTLDNVTVAGQLKVLGGGSNSVHLNNVKAVKIIVGKEGVRLVFGEGTTVQELTVSESSVIENNGAEIARITISADGKVTLSGKFDEVTVEGEGGIVLDNAEIKVLTVEKAITISGKGTIERLTANANGIKYEADVKIDKTELGSGVTEEPTKVKDDTTTGGGGGGNPSDNDDDDDETKDYRVEVSVGLPNATSPTAIYTDKYSSSDVLSVFLADEAKDILNKTDENTVKKYTDKINARLENIKINAKSFFSEDAWNASMKYMEGTTLSAIKGKVASLQGDLLDDKYIDKNDLLEIFNLYKEITVDEAAALKDNIIKDEDFDSKEFTYNDSELKYSITLEKGNAPVTNKEIAVFLLDQFRSKTVKDFFDAYGKVTIKAIYGGKEALITLNSVPMP